MKKLIAVHILTIVAFAFVAFSNLNQSTNSKRILEFNTEINGIDSNLLEAIIRIESNGNFKARGDFGEIGAMQIIPKYHLKRCGLNSENELLEPHKNIMCGAEILKHYLKITNNNLREALAMYNGGYSKSAQAYIYADKVLDVFAKL